MPLTIITFNTFGIPLPTLHAKLRYSLFSQELSALHPDIICFQEVHTYGLLKILRQNLSQFEHWAYQPAKIGPWGGIVTASQHLLESTSFTGFEPSILPPTQNLLRVFDRRFIGKGILTTAIPALDLTIINVHLSANFNADWSDTSPIFPVYLEELRRLERLATSIPTRHLAIAGDFNIAKQSNLYPQIRTLPKIIDSFASITSDNTYHQIFLPVTRQPQWIDYLLTPKHANIIKSSILFTQPIVTYRHKPLYASDHKALLATFKLI